MKRNKASFFVIVMLLASLVLLNGCGSISSGDLIGTWSGSWEWNGDQINSSIQFERSGEYAKVNYTNNSASKSETGTYEIKGSKVILHEGGNLEIEQEYKYSNGKLTNNGHSLSKES